MQSVSRRSRGSSFSWLGRLWKSIQGALAMPADEAPGKRRRLRGVQQLEDRCLLSATLLGQELVKHARAIDKPVWAMPTAVAMPGAVVGAISETNPPLGNRQLAAAATMQVPAASRHEIVFIDTSVQDYQQLARSFLANTDPTRTIDVVYLDPSRNGVEQITRTLANYDNLDAVHIISHGSDSAVRLGNQWLDGQTLQAYAQDVRGWSAALKLDADLLIYGCDVAQSSAGQQFLSQLGALTGADVAASTDPTGQASLGGNWSLEYVTGSIETSVAPSAQAQTDWQGLLATITVTNTSDVVNGDTSSVANLIASSGGDGISLREAIMATNNTPGADTIFLPAGTVTFTQVGAESSNTPNAAVNDLDITDTLTIRGAGMGVSIVDANSIHRIFQIHPGVTATIQDLTIRGGLTDATTGLGGGIYVKSATLSLDRVEVTANVSTFGGGGITNEGGTLFLTDVVISNNTATKYGGGLQISAGGTATLNRVTISGNTAGLQGGGIYDYSGSAASLTNVTISANSAVTDGGGIYTRHDTTLTNVTIAYNTAANGAGFFQENGPTYTVSAVNTILAYNTDAFNTGENSNKAFNAGTYNIDTDGTAQLTGPTNLNNVDPLLGPLGNNGGFTPTHALLAGSPAINAATATGTPTTDQRGYARNGATDIGAVEFNGVAPNRPPTANDDSYSVNEDASLNVTGGTGVLANDSDPDADPLTATVISGPANGALTLSADGSFTYTPNANFNGADTFTYRANDGTANSNVATVTIMVTPVNDAPTANADSYSVNLLSTLNVPAPGVLANDTDTEGDPLTATLVTGPTNGTLSLNPDGSFQYVPNLLFLGVDSFTYQASDGMLVSSPATVTITVTLFNGPPTANSDLYTTAEDTPLSVTAPGVLANDADPNGDPLTAVLVSAPSNGSLTLNATGAFLYTPAANFNGVDTFTYQANDGVANSNVATVTLVVTAVNDAPTANGDTFSMNEDGTLNVPAPGVLGNDTDIDGDPLKAVLASGPSNAAAFTLNADGSFAYAPNANFTGTDTFTYKANDGSADSNVATVTITVNPVNDTPVINLPGTQNTSMNVPVQFSSGNGNLISVSDVDAGGNLVRITLDATEGTLTLSGTTGLTFSAGNGVADAKMVFTGTLADINTALDGMVFTPKSNYAGNNASVKITSDDLGNTGAGGALTDVNTVAISFDNVAPVALADTYNVSEDTVLTVSSAGVLTNDYDANGDPLTAVVVSGPANGSLTLNASGSFTYTPNANFNGTDSFTYKANDGSADSNVATVTITVNPVNDPPVAGNDSYSTNEDTALNAAAAAVLANDVDVEGNSLTALLVSAPTNGTLLLNADGSFSYTPNANFNGTDSFTYKANDGSADSNVAMVTITVNPVNDRPVAGNDSYSTNEDTVLNVAAAGVLANDSDIDGNPLTAILVGSSANGSLTLNADGSFTFIPDPDFNGNYTFTYKANDGSADSNAVTVSITVNPVNDPPVRTAGTVNNSTMLEDSNTTSLGLGSLRYSGGSGAEASQTLSYQVTAVPAASLGNVVLADGVTVVAANTNYSLTEMRGMQFQAAADASGGPATLAWSVQDDGGTANAGNDTLTESLTVTVTAVNDAPVRTGGAVQNQVVQENSGTTSLGLSSLSYGVGGGADEVGQTITYNVTAIPVSTLGAIVLADGVTVVTANTSYTLTELQGMQFKTATNATGGPATFSWTVQDDGGTANGGIDTRAESKTITVAPALPPAPPGVPSTPPPSPAPAPPPDKPNVPILPPSLPILPAPGLPAGVASSPATAGEVVQTGFLQVVASTADAAIHGISASANSSSGQAISASGLVAPQASVALVTGHRENYRDVVASARNEVYVPAPPTTLDPFGTATLVGADGAGHRSARFESGADYWWTLDDIEQPASFQETSEPIGAVVATGLLATAGFFLLNTRTGFWLLSLMAARPLWKQFDPLEILYAWDDEAADYDERRKETLASLVD